MPQSAIDAVVVDFILSPEKMAEQLLQIAQSYKGNGVHAEGDEQLPKSDEENFRQIITLLRQHSSVDFTYYKQNA